MALEKGRDVPLTREVNETLSTLSNKARPVVDIHFSLLAC